jgi:predicted XRE-type DNA-binding protein
LGYLWHTLGLKPHNAQPLSGIEGWIIEVVSLKKKKENNMSDKIKFTKSSGNIYTDMGFKDAKERIVKADLAIMINQIIKQRNFNQNEAADILGINQPKVSAIANGRLKDFSIERLIEFLNRLDQDVEITIHEKPRNAKRAALFTVAMV